MFCVLFFIFIFNGTRDMKNGRKFHFAGIYLFKFISRLKIATFKLKSVIFEVYDTYFFEMLWYSQHRAFLKKIPIGYHLFLYNHHVLKFEKNLQLLIVSMFFFQFLNSKCGYLKNCMTTKLFGLL